MPPPVAVPVNCRALFYRDKKSEKQGDASGFYQGLADLLEKRNVIRNDSLILTWDGSRVYTDIENPRTEVVLEAVAAEELQPKPKARKKVLKQQIGREIA